MSTKIKNCEYSLERQEKKCSVCGEVKPFSAFNKSKNGKGGRNSQCKDCIRCMRGHTPRRKIFLDQDAQLKECSVCSRIKPFSEFYKDASRPDGLHSRCIICYRKSKGTSPRKKVVVVQDQELKQCSMCKKLLPFSSFHKSSKKCAGLTPACAKCNSLAGGHKPRKKMFLDMDAELKQCRDCERILPFSMFTKDSRLKSGLTHNCKDCVLKYKDANREKLRATDKRSSEKHIEKRRAKSRKYNRENRDKFNEYVANRMRTDINFKLKQRLRSRLANAIKHGYKSGSAVRDLGCSIEYLKVYLESKFYDRSTGEKMDWSKHTNHGWHIDHIKPLAAFDLTDRDQLLEACHYTNLQPLWCEDNFAKGDRIEC